MPLFIKNVEVRCWTGSPLRAERIGFRAFEIAHPHENVSPTEGKERRGWIVMARCEHIDHATTAATALHKTYGWRVETWQVPSGTEGTRTGC